MQAEYKNLILENPDIADPIQKYFENIQRLKAEELKQTFRLQEEEQKSEESKDTKTCLISPEKLKAVNLRRREFLRNFTLESLETAGIDLEKAQKIQYYFNEIWARAKEEDYTEIEKFFDLVEKIGLVSAFEKQTTIEIKRQNEINENNLESFSMTEFLKLFDPYLLTQIGGVPRQGNNAFGQTGLKLSNFETADKLKWLQTREENYALELIADLSEQSNEQAVANKQA